MNEMCLDLLAAFYVSFTEGGATMDLYKKGNEIYLNFMQLDVCNTV